MYMLTEYPVSQDQDPECGSIRVMKGGHRDSDSGSSSSGGDSTERGNWGSQLEFVLSCLSYAVGLGNIWRFPYLCYRNGGGAFLIPYAIMLLTCGLPLFFFELSLGQYVREGPVTIWKICPIFGGLGYAMFMISFVVGIYYNMIIAWALYYLWSSLSSSLPWTSCDNLWNTEACQRYDAKNCTSFGGFLNLTTGDCIINGTVSDDEWEALKNASEALKRPADEFFHNFVLGISAGIHHFGELRYPLAICLLVAWIIVFFALLKGVQSFGKAVYFTAIFPYIVLLVLLVRAATLPGYMDGIMFYLTPEWEKLLHPSVWGDAATQIFFSLSPCWGGLITLASYNKDAVIVSFGNCLTSFFAGFVIFGIVGFMAHSLGVPVKEVVANGPGLAFIAYPEAVARLPLSPLWAVLFFVMLLTLGLGTQFTIMETVVTTIQDLFPSLLRRYHLLTLATCCTVMYLLGLSMCSEAGMYILQLADNHAATFSALIVGCVESIAIAHVYGINRFMGNIEEMLGRAPPLSWYWKAMWSFGTPFLLLVILFLTFLDFKTTTYGEYEYPVAANVIGWFISFVSVAMIPLVAIYLISKAQGTLWERIVSLCQDTTCDNNTDSPTPSHPAFKGPAKKQLHLLHLSGIGGSHADSQTPLTTILQEEEPDEAESDRLDGVSDDGLHILFGKSSDSQL
ncbi:unnamed protein product [Cyprideis torosa]|uniref:Transporter n=1 Tax=Cyprideis torosa TaxID=163714 RepID=A0A7R8W0D1_9CRUS|nr:unnamed protein product [Cyprideis torosa]CAG0879633.1 unnamed protein product [Cyprideis torosa]